MDSRELDSIEEARFVLGGISRATIYDLLNSGELPSVVIGRRWFMAATAIAAFIATSPPVSARERSRCAPRRFARKVLNKKLKLRVTDAEDARTAILRHVENADRQAMTRTNGLRIRQCINQATVLEESPALRVGLRALYVQAEERQAV
jgi:hypothetical protein